MNEFLDENAPLELNVTVYCKNCIKNILCLKPIGSAFTYEDHFNKQFVCKNETFDEKGRLIVFYSKTIFCELEKVTAELFEQYHPLDLYFKDSKFYFLSIFLSIFQLLGFYDI